MLIDLRATFGNLARDIGSKSATGMNVSIEEGEMILLLAIAERLEKIAELLDKPLNVYTKDAPANCGLGEIDNP